MQPYPGWLPPQACQNSSLVCPAAIHGLGTHPGGASLCLLCGHTKYRPMLQFSMSFCRGVAMFWCLRANAHGHQVQVCFWNSLYETQWQFWWFQSATYECQAGFSSQPHPVWHFFYGLHERMRAVAAEAGLLLGSGCQVPFLCNANVVLHSDDSQSLQHLIDSMPGFASA